MPQNNNLIKVLVIIASIIAIAVIGYFVYKHFFPTPVSTQTVNQTTTTTVVNYDATYKGDTSVAYGLAGASLKVKSSKITGTALYKATMYGYKVSLPATIKGTLSTTGVVTGTIKVSGTVYGQAVSLKGSANGQITGSKMKCTYGVSGNAGSYGGQITLTKQK